MALGDNYAEVEEAMMEVQVYHTDQQEVVEDGYRPTRRHRLRQVVVHPNHRDCLEVEEEVGELELAAVPDSSLPIVMACCCCFHLVSVMFS